MSSNHFIGTAIFAKSSCDAVAPRVLFQKFDRYKLFDASPGLHFFNKIKNGFPHEPMGGSVQLSRRRLQPAPRFFVQLDALRGNRNISYSQSLTRLIYSYTEALMHQSTHYQQRNIRRNLYLDTT